MHVFELDTLRVPCAAPSLFYVCTKAPTMRSQGLTGLQDRRTSQALLLCTACIAIMIDAKEGGS